VKDISEHHEEAQRLYESIPMQARWELLEEVECWCFSDEEADSNTVNDAEDITVDMISRSLFEMRAEGVCPAERYARAWEIYAVPFARSES